VTFQKLCESGNLDKVRTFLKQNSSADVVCYQDKNGWTPLLCAAAGRHLKLCLLLLSFGADPRRCNNMSVGFLHFIARISPVTKLVVKCLRQGIKKGADPCAVCREGHTPLHEAAAAGAAATCAYLIKHGTKINIRDQFGETCLHYAIRGEHKQVVLHLLDAGADPTILGSRGTPAEVAQRGKNSEYFCKIIKKYTEQPITQPKGKFIISGPSNYTHSVHVDHNFVWETYSGDAEVLPFKIIDEIGSGANGVVYRAQHESTGQDVAIKSLRVNRDSHREWQAEIQVLRQCSYSSIITYWGCFSKGGSELWIMMDFCEAGALSDIMDLIKRPFNEDEIRHILYQVVCGLDYLHSRKILHRDLKGGNILLTKKGEVKITDFGISTPLMERTLCCARTTIGTPCYMSPEVISGSRYDTSADVWSIGITAIELAQKNPPLFDESFMRVMYKIVNEDAPRLANHFSPDFRSFVEVALQKDPAVRATPVQLKEHPFFSSVPKDNFSPRVLQRVAEAAIHARKVQKVLAENPSAPIPEFVPQPEQKPDHGDHVNGAGPGEPKEDEEEEDDDDLSSGSFNYDEMDNEIEEEFQRAEAVAAAAAAPATAWESEALPYAPPATLNSMAMAGVSNISSSPVHRPIPASQSRTSRAASIVGAAPDLPAHGTPPSSPMPMPMSALISPRQSPGTSRQSPGVSSDFSVGSLAQKFQGGGSGSGSGVPSLQMHASLGAVPARAAQQQQQQNKPTPTRTTRSVTESSPRSARPLPAPSTASPLEGMRPAFPHPAGNPPLTPMGNPPLTPARQMENNPIKPNQKPPKPKKGIVGSLLGKASGSLSSIASAKPVPVEPVMKYKRAPPPAGRKA